MKLIRTYLALLLLVYSGDCAEAVGRLMNTGCSPDGWRGSLQRHLADDRGLIGSNQVMSLKGVDHFRHPQFQADISRVSESIPLSGYFQLQYKLHHEYVWSTSGEHLLYVGQGGRQGGGMEEGCQSGSQAWARQSSAAHAAPSTSHSGHLALIRVRCLFVPKKETNNVVMPLCHQLYLLCHNEQYN